MFSLSICCGTKSQTKHRPSANLGNVLATKVCPLWLPSPLRFKQLLQRWCFYLPLVQLHSMFFLSFTANVWLEKTTRWQMSFLIRDLGGPCTFFINTIPNLKFSSAALHLLPPNRTAWKELIGFSAALTAVPSAVIKKNAGEKRRNGELQRWGRTVKEDINV